jgi:hypothetical protein
VLSAVPCLVIPLRVKGAATAVGVPSLDVDAAKAHAVLFRCVLTMLLLHTWSWTADHAWHHGDRQHVCLPSASRLVPAC